MLLAACPVSNTRVAAPARLQALRNNSHCVLVTTLTGGHLGWVAGKGAPTGAPWSNEASLEWLLATLARGGSSASVQLELAGAKA